MNETAASEESIFQSLTGKSERAKKLQSLTPKSTSNQKSQSLTGQFTLFRHYHFSLNWSHYVFLLPKDANIHAREYQLYLPSKEELRQKLQEWAGEADNG